MTDVFNPFDDEKILKIDMRANWNANVKNEECGICKYNIFEKPPNSEGDHSVVIGTCGHCYHKDCIATWLSTRNNCPYCNAKWSYQTGK